MGSLRWHGPAARRLVEAAAERQLRRAGAAVVAHARRLAPVRTGALRDSIGYEVRRAPRGPVLVVFAAVPYAIYVEFGTSRMGARPYLRPAIAQVFRGSLANTPVLVRFAQPGRPE